MKNHTFTSPILNTAFLLSLFLTTVMASAKETETKKKETLYFTSLEWPPYLSSTLPDNGLGIAVVKEAFKKEGYEIQIDFYPWTRCLKLVETTSKYTGVLLGYKDSEREKLFLFSEKVMGSPVGFAERKDHIIKWHNLTDLKTQTFGIVQDYVNTTEIDSAIAAKSIQAETAVSDSLNLVKLANKRMDLAVIDSNTFDYLMATDSNVSKYQSSLQMNKKIFEDKGLYALFRKDDDGKKWLTIFNAGLKKINVAEFVKNYKEKHFTKH